MLLFAHCSGRGGTEGPAIAQKADRASTESGAAAASVESTTDRNSASSGTATAVGGLPRFERLWRREGLGRFDGAAHAGMYYTIANDGRSMYAVDVASGKTVWRTALAQPCEEWGRTRVAGDAVMLMCSRGSLEDGSADSVVMQLSAIDGRVRWSNVFECPGADSRFARGRLYLLCQSELTFPKIHEIRELDPSRGTQRSRISVGDRFDVASDDRMCGASGAETWCGRVAGDHLAIDWKQPGEGARFEIAGQYVVRAGAELVVRSTTDGRLLWRWPAPGSFFAEATSGRLFVTRSDGFDVLRLADGSRLLDVPAVHLVGAKFLSDGERVVVVPHGPAKAVYLVDASSRLRTIAKNLTFLDDAASGVLVSRNVGMSGMKRDVAPLEAYSLVKFLPPENSLDPPHRVIAVLERFPLGYEATRALVEIQSIPGGMAALEEVLRTGPTDLRSIAAAIAGITRDPRFVEVLRERLEALGALPTSVDDWELLGEVVEALSQLDSPEAPTALLTFWNRLGESMPASRRRTFLRDAVAASVWRYGAHKDWVSCRDTTFPIGTSDPDHASIGTPSPGTEYEVDRQRRWAAICEAREDTDHSGALAVRTFMHGDTGGDQLRPYLVLRSGRGTEIDDFVGSDPSGRWIVVTRNMCVHLVDARSGTSIALRGADGRPGDPIGGSHRAASFSPDGTSMVYLRSDGSHSLVVQRDLASGSERILDPGSGELSRAFFDESGRFVVMDVVTADTNGDGRLEPPRLSATLARRRCRALTISSTSFGMAGDRPIQRIAMVHGDVTVTDAPAGTAFQPASSVEPPYELISSPPSPPYEGTELPFGPFHWQPRR